ncbi:MAG: chromosome segregation protein SMC [Candidatus Krumholzibacteriia bacterium]
MRLKKLEISGFKSFLNRLEMDFSEGVTAVLGPNGCGKTNIVDAIRWVLGEQKTRMLRNTKMENVIFNGTKLRKPLGMAEVHMTMSNENGAMPLDYGDITISRKLYRSGLSEYQLNGELVRLKDIKNLLVDTGLGSHTYSIIEREMVDSVISDKDQDKRHLLEEAAGVMRYRLQREEALRKIKHTEADLTRLGDILVELEKEIRSLRYQMGKANRFARLKERVDRMEAALIKRSLLELLEKRDAARREREHHEGITLADDNEITRLESHLQESRIRGSELERRLQDLQENRFELSQSLQQREERIAILTERIASTGNRIREDEEEIVRAEDKLISLADEFGGYQSAIEDKERMLATQREDLAAREASLAEVSAELEALKTRLRDKKQLALDLVREKERERGEREHLHNRLFEIEEKNQKENTQQDSLKREEMELVEKLASQRDVVAGKRADVSSVLGALEKASRDAERAVDLLAACEDHHATVNIELNRLTERREYLERLEQEHGRDEDDTIAGSSIKGVLADHIRVEKKYRRCFEACLAPVLQGLLAGSEAGALRCLDAIQKAGKGRYQLLYPNGGRAGADVPAAGGVLGRAIDFVDGDTSVMDFLRPYLADVVVTKDVPTAVAAMADDRIARVATLDGVYFDGPGRILVAGADDIEITLLEIDSKLEELTALIAKAKLRTSTLQSRKEKLICNKKRFIEETAQLRERLHETEVEKDRAQERHRTLEIGLVRVREKLATLSASVIENQESMREIQERLGAGPRAVEELVDVDTTDDELSALENRAVELERRKESIGESAARIRLGVVTVTGEITTAKEKRSNTEMLQGEMRELVSSRQQDARRCGEEITAAEGEIDGSRTQIAELHARLEAAEKEISQVKESRDGVKEKCNGVEEELKELKGRRDQKKENLQRCDLELATIDTRIGSLTEKAKEDFNQDLDPYLSNRDLFDPAEWERMDHDDLASLKRQIESFGPVNMLALDEHKEKKERFEFLSQQKADLDEARETLIQAIRRINNEARRRLSDTFEKVRVNFKQTFLTLFDGGEADLLFVDSDDPLEANIKIVANPKGKRLHDISSLSGGERALVALSLLFAIYLVKPSPFCVFDEVDAPLDDANIARFVNMIHSSTGKTQFIVITHNKKTMEAADNLYGVTMAEPGVSRMISVHIGDVDKIQSHTHGRRSPGSPAAESTEEVSVQS